MRTEKDILTDMCYDYYKQEHGKSALSFDDFINKTMSDIEFSKYFDILWKHAIKERSIEKRNSGLNN